MAMLGGAPARREPPPVPYRERCDLACALLRRDAPAEAYRLLAALAKERETPEVLINLGLCHMRAGRWEAALAPLDGALALAKRLDKRGDAPGDETHAVLLRLQAASESYREPLPDGLAELRPEYVRDTAARLLIDVCARLGLRERVNALAGPLAGKGYANVESAIKEMEG